MARPDLKQQGVNNHTEAEIRINIEMGKLALEAIKKYKTMFKNFDKLPAATQWKLLSHCMNENKEFMSKHREQLLGNTDKEESVEEEDDMISIELTSPETDAQRLN